MDKRKVRKFKNQQKRLAKKIAETCEIQSFSVDYEQILPSAFINWETNKMAIGNTSQIVFPTKDIHKGKKHRVIVVMHFSGNFCNSDVIGRILRRQFSIIRSVDEGFEVRSSFTPSSIGKLQ